MAVFYEDLVISNNSPMAILYETLQRRGEKVNYKQLFNGAGTTNPIYKYRASALGFTVVSEGKTMKEAKNDAAAALLQRIQTYHPDVRVQPAESEDNPSPYSCSPKENCSINMLEEICWINKIPMAVFKLRSEQGPADAKTFTVECTISSCTEVAAARTEKEASHMAAQQMINSVKDILGFTFVPISEKSVNMNNPDEPPNLSCDKDVSFSHDMSIPLAEAHNVFFIKQEELKTPEEFFNLCKKPLDYYQELKNPKEFLRTLVWKLGGICQTTVASKSGMEQSKESTCSSKFNIESDREPIEPVNIVEKPFSEEEHFARLTKKFGLTNIFGEHLSQPLLNDEPTLENDENDSESIETSEGHIGRQTQYDNGLMMLFLTIKCPQGQYGFTAVGASYESAERQAASDALEFFWMMSLPRTGFSDDPLDFLTETSSSSCSSERVSYISQF